MKKRLLIFITLILTITYSYAEKNNFRKHYERGKVFLKNKLYEKAIEEYKKAIEINPDFKEAYLKIAICYDQYLKNYSEAVKYYLKYIEKSGEKSDEIKKIVSNIVNLKYETTDKEFEQLKKAVQFYNKGIKLGKEKKFDKAIKYFKKSLDIAPHYVKSHYALGLAYFNTRDYKNAYNHLLYAVKIDPENPEIKEAYLKLALIADDLFLRDYEMAELFYTKYIQVNGANTAQAKKLLNVIQKVNNLISSAGSFYSMKKLKEAKEKLQEALKLKPFEIRALNNLGIIYLAENRFDSAIAQFKKALNIKEDLGDTYYNLACAYSKKGDTKSALNYFKKGIKYFSNQLIQKALKDEDLKNLRKEKEFKKIIEKFIK